MEENNKPKVESPPIDLPQRKPQPAKRSVGRPRKAEGGEKSKYMAKADRYNKILRETKALIEINNRLISEITQLFNRFDFRAIADRFHEEYKYTLEKIQSDLYPHLEAINVLK